MYEARIYFESFYGEEDFTLKIDLDITEFDQIILPIQLRSLIHSYSDSGACSASLRCLKLEELLAAKLVALLHRQHSPDLFDFIYSIFFQRSLAVGRSEIITTFLRKTICEPTPQVAKSLLLDLPFTVLRGLWQKYLVCPRDAVVPFEHAEREFRRVIDELFALVIGSMYLPQPVVAQRVNFRTNRRACYCAREIPTRVYFLNGLTGLKGPSGVAW